MVVYEVDIAVFEQNITEGAFLFYRENDSKNAIDVWIQHNGFTLHSIYRKPVFPEGDEFGEAGAVAYRNWKNEHLHTGIPVLSIEHHSVEVVVNGGK